VRSATDSLSSATDVEDASATLAYSWRNTGTVANVNHSTTTRAGTAQVVITAADRSEVYSNVLVPSLNEPTNSGPPGDWTIRLVLSGYSGTLNFRVEEP
jgi:hypothetical protein